MNRNTLISLIDDIVRHTAYGGYILSQLLMRPGARNMAPIPAGLTITDELSGYGRQQRAQIRIRGNSRALPAGVRAFLSMYSLRCRADSSPVSARNAADEVDGRPAHE